VRTEGGAQVVQLLAGLHPTGLDLARDGLAHRGAQGHARLLGIGDAEGRFDAARVPRRHHPRQLGPPLTSRRRGRLDCQFGDTEAHCSTVMRSLLLPFCANRGLIRGGQISGPRGVPGLDGDHVGLRRTPGPVLDLAPQLHHFQSISVDDGDDPSQRLGQHKGSAGQGAAHKGPAHLVA